MSRVSKRKMEELRQKILEKGVPCTLAVVWSDKFSPTDPLLMIEIHPTNGFTHLIKKDSLSEAFKEVGFYHISIAFRSDFKKMSLKLPNVDELVQQIYNALDGWSGSVNVDYFTGQGCAIVEEFIAAVCPAAKTLFDNGSYAYKKDMHISM